MNQIFTISSIFFLTSHFVASLPIFLNKVDVFKSKSATRGRFYYRTKAFLLPPGVDSGDVAMQATSAISTYFGLIAYYDRPRGKYFVEDALEVKKSQVPNAGLGLYLTRSLPEGTRLGTYPGVVRPISKSLQKLRNYPRCEAYIWRFTDDIMIVDPTDSMGRLQDVCYGGSDEMFLSSILMHFLHKIGVNPGVKTYLSRINEPPRGMGFDCNVRTFDDIKSREVVFELSRDVHCGEELFMDYGLTYDRTSYGKPMNEIS